MRLMSCLFGVVVALMPAVADAAECHAKPDPKAAMNMNAILTGAPQFVKVRRNGGMVLLCVLSAVEETRGKLNQRTFSVAPLCNE